MNTANASADVPKPDPKFGRLGPDSDHSHSLRKTTARGGLHSMLGQLAGVVLRLGSMVIVARLVSKEEFGIVNMVTAFTGFLALFRDGGLSLATIQRPSITEAQTSTLFWINSAAGCLLALICVAIAPVLAWFYSEPRLVWVTVALATAFIFYGVSAQHRALLQRKMRFGTLAIVEVVSLAVSIVATITAAKAGLGYWALVIMAAGPAMISAIGVWAAVGWMPGRPSRGSGVLSMMQFGGVITLNSFVVYLAYNTEKVLLGRFWGAEVLGVYGRAYSLISLPSENLNTVVSSVMFPVLSRVQNDPARLRNYFIMGYGMFLAVVLPITAACGLFADDIVRVILGPQWTSAVPVFRLLTPTILTLTMINPLAWMLQASGLANRSLKMSFLIAPAVVIGYWIGLGGAAEGVALGYSIAMLLLVLPIIKWATHGTQITMKDVLGTALRPGLAVIVAGILSFGVDWLLRDMPSAFLRLCIVSALLFGIYGAVLLFGLGQLPKYMDLLRASGVLKEKKI